jgi:hypothetical protein
MLMVGALDGSLYYFSAFRSNDQAPAAAEVAAAVSEK